MKKNHNSFDYLMDPHTAVASEAVDELSGRLEGRTIILSTAHPAKFPLVVEKAGLSLGDIPENLSIIFDKDERSYSFQASKELIFNFITKNNS